MAITSASTRTQVLAQYNDNLAWEGDVAKAVLELEAVRWLLANRPSRFTHGERSQEYESLAEQRSRLEAYVRIAGSAAKFVTFTQGVPRT